ncbi:helix-turn-helix domain-containing protein [Colwellia psychrerythraea]|uniref:Transcriptional regulator, AraC family n=1 Tax=Colwellia psychrerythraea TaxID=28229 RepID=A0A099KBD2_COLPS|nr:helix-turn-helix domain-containing protein [Colwellia psychrerythraea]KGJ86923.1 transcriptional regulator, AraC family [Colwellia psychrerythraea]
MEIHQAVPYTTTDSIVREISTSDVDELSQFQLHKNRRYTQLQPGKLNGEYLEANLGDVQIFRENLNAGALIEAAPASTFLPFAAVISNADNFNYCGKQRGKNTILQATGGFWDASFKQHLKFIVAAFDRETFCRNIELLTGEEIPNIWLISKASLTEPSSLKNYADGLESILTTVQNSPEILKKENAQRMLADSILRLTLAVLTKTTPINEQQVNQSNRVKGVRLVIDYLHHYAAQVPTIPELCNIAQLSERNLQYAFKEYLGITPIRYLRLVRLNGVKRDLVLAHPKKDRIVDIALNWGFIELGRFAGEYRQLFQELPSVTLNNNTMV